MKKPVKKRYKKDKRRTVGVRMLFLVALFSLSFVASAPRVSHAQVCEMPFVPPIAAGVSAGVMELMIQTMLFPSNPGSPPRLSGNIDGLADIGLDGATGGCMADFDILAPIRSVPVVGSIISGVLGSQLGLQGDAGYVFGGTNCLDERVRDRMYQFWDQELGHAFRMMTAQLASSDVNTARMLASIFDASNLSDSGVAHQLNEAKARRDHLVSDEMCRFDTAAVSLRETQYISKGVATASAVEVNQYGDNRQGGPAAAGTSSFVPARMQNYRTALCDPAANGGTAPCAAAGSQPNAGVLPSKTIFGHETIDLTDADTRTAVSELGMNITGFHPPEPQSSRVQASTAGREGRQRNREYLAQMDAVTGLVGSVVGDRAPGPVNTDVRDSRVKSGVQPADASSRPSEKETLQSTQDQLADSNFYVNMNDVKGTVAQKEAFYKAYNALMIYKIIEKQERISNALAIETANMLEMRYAKDALPQFAPQ